MNRPRYQLSVVGAVLGAVALLAGACVQDPYRYLQNPDGGSGRDLPNFVDGIKPPDWALHDGRPRTDAPPDLGPPDLSYDACKARVEVCNNLDDNCDGTADEGFDKLNDPRYCEKCKGCAWLFALNAVPGCVAGQCVIPAGGCAGGYQDLDKKVSTGCEYRCTATGPEMCDGADNDCNGVIDDGVQFSQNTCLQLGACAGAKPVCRGAQGWVCDYGVDVELLPCTKDADCGSGIKCQNNVCPGVVTTNETRCDGKDNDCDGLADDPWANAALTTALGKECSPDPSKQGVCRATGVYVCNSAGTGVECQITTPAQAPSDEVCNGKDDDCDGKVDEVEDDTAGKGVKDPMVHVQRTVSGKAYDFWIYKYEAARPDASAALVGGSAARACSKAGVLPWGNSTYAQADAACKAAGKRLCKGDEWQVACMGAAATTYPYGATYQPQSCNGSDRGLGAPTITGNLGACEGGETGLYDLSGNLREWTDDPRGTTSGPTPKKIYAVRGGAYHTPALGLSCTFDLSQAVEDVVLPANGFRCCANQAD